MAVVACGGILGEVRRAAAALKADGIIPTLVSLHTVKPIDADLLVRLARSHRAMLTVEEHVLNGGLGSAVAEVLADAQALPPEFRLLGIENCFVSEVGSQEYLRRRVGIDAEGVGRAIRELLA